MGQEQISTWVLKVLYKTYLPTLFENLAESLIDLGSDLILDSRCGGQLGPRKNPAKIDPVRSPLILTRLRSSGRLCSACRLREKKCSCPDKHSPSGVFAIEIACRVEWDRQL